MSCNKWRTSVISPIRNDLELFEYNLKRLMDCEDRLHEINEELSGKVSSPSIKSIEEAKYQSGTKIYRNNIAELMYEEEQLIKDRDYYLRRVKTVESFLQKLSDDEVYLLELKYWHRFSFKAMSKILYISIPAVYKKINSIFKKV